MDGVLIASIIGLALTVIGHLCSTVWWMSKITTKLDLFIDLVKEVKKDSSNCVQKENCIQMMATLEKEVDELWKKYDESQK